MEDSGTHLVAVMQEANGGYSESILDLASADPPIVKGISGHPVPAPRDLVPAAADDQDIATQVQAHVADLGSKNVFSGAILIAHNGMTVMDQAWGMANTHEQIANTTDTQFCMGSMNKMFTAVAVLQLVQQGKLSLDAPIDNYWHDYPNRDLASRVTIRQL